MFGQSQNSFPYKNKDLSSRLHNKDTFYAGEANREKIFKIRFDSVKKNVQRPETYVVLGVIDFNGKFSKFEGEIIFKELFGVRNEPESVLLFGEFNFRANIENENPSVFKGKIRMQTTKDIPISYDGANVTFKGELNINEKEIHQIWFSNFTHNDIDKVIFR